ncbi:MAG: cytochrome P450, partial [Tsuneonella sp.]
MATLPLEMPTSWTTSPRASDALEKALKDNPQVIPHHSEKWDVSRSDIYYEDRWQPIFREMRAAGDLHKVEDSPFGPHWNVVSHRAIQHIEALPDLYSSA